MKINSPKQLKDWISNMAKKNNLVATVLQNYMMERFLERVSQSRYKDNFILKGGFLIAAMVGIDMRSTMDMDTTLKGLPVDRNTMSSGRKSPKLCGEWAVSAMKFCKPLIDLEENEKSQAEIEAIIRNIKIDLVNRRHRERILWSLCKHRR